jgi:signal transduction histidine kinase
MLESIARDLETPKPREEQAEEAKGKTGTGDEASAAAQGHGAARAERGFTVGEMVAEFRALRATVMRLWTEQQGEIAHADLDDTDKFHQAIDQAIAESITQYTRELNRSKDRFLAILGHDLRNPLSAISMSAAIMLESGALPGPTVGTTEVIARSASRMNQMVGDLIDFARGQFGQGMPIARAETDLGKVLNDVVAEVGASYPKSRVNVDAGGELIGNWDSTRLAQALTNLVTNAVHHGSSDTPINVVVQGMPDEVVLSVQNQGPVIPSERLDQILDGTAPTDAARADAERLGLGLYITGQIVKAHGGSIDASSSADSGTVFTMHLPR